MFFLKKNNHPKFVNGIFANFKINLKTGQSFEQDSQEFWDIENRWIKENAIDQIMTKCRSMGNNGTWNRYTFHPGHSIESVSFAIQEYIKKEIK